MTMNRDEIIDKRLAELFSAMPYCAPSAGFNAKVLAGLRAKPQLPLARLLEFSAIAWAGAAATAAWLLLPELASWKTVMLGLKMLQKAYFAAQLLKPVSNAAAAAVFSPSALAQMAGAALIAAVFLIAISHRRNDIWVH